MKAFEKTVFTPSHAASQFPVKTPVMNWMSPSNIPMISLTTAINDPMEFSKSPTTVFHTAVKTASTWLRMSESFVRNRSSTTVINVWNAGVAASSSKCPFILLKVSPIGSSDVVILSYSPITPSTMVSFMDVKVPENISMTGCNA